MPGCGSKMHEEIKALRVEMQAGFARIDARIDSMQRLMIAALLTIVLGFIVDKV